MGVTFFKKISVYIHVCEREYVCVCMCICVSEREREQGDGGGTQLPPPPQKTCTDTRASKRTPQHTPTHPCANNICTQVQTRKQNPKKRQVRVPHLAHKEGRAHVEGRLVVDHPLYYMCYMGVHVRVDRWGMDESASTPNGNIPTAHTHTHHPQNKYIWLTE